MVAYSFKARFAAPILAGMRTKHCRRLGEPVCLDVVPVRLCFSANAAAELFEVDGTLLSPASMERFARADGFESVADMAAFWRDEHPSIADVGEFRGWLIRWEPLAPVEAADVLRSDEGRTGQ